MAGLVAALLPTLLLGPARDRTRATELDSLRREVAQLRIEVATASHAPAEVLLPAAPTTVQLPPATIVPSVPLDQPVAGGRVNGHPLVASIDLTDHALGSDVNGGGGSRDSQPSPDARFVDVAGDEEE